MKNGTNGFSTFYCIASTGQLANMNMLIFEVKKEEIQKSDNEIDIVSTPAVFKVPYRTTYFTGEVDGLNLKILNKLKPKLIIIFIDDLLRVKERTNNDPLRKVMNLELIDLAEWRESAIQIIKSYAEEMVGNGKQVDFLMFAKEHPPKTLVKLIINEQPRLYISYHITGQEDFKDVQRFINKLKKTFICIDPYSIKDWLIVNSFDNAIEKNINGVSIKVNYSDGTKLNTEISLKEAKDAIDLIRSQIVERDLDIIANVHATVVYHKSEDPSYGVMVEVFHSAVIVQKPVYVLYPFEIRPSPFFEYYFKPNNVIQGKEDIEEMENQLVAQLEKEYKEWMSWDPK